MAGTSERGEQSLHLMTSLMSHGYACHLEALDDIYVSKSHFISSLKFNKNK